MLKIFHVAWREFTTTVLTKAFLLGLILPPAIMTIAVVLIPLLMRGASPKVEGHVAIIDQSGVIAPKLEEALSPDAMAKRRAKKVQDAVDVAPVPEPLKEQARSQANIASSGLSSTELRVWTLAPDASVEVEKKPILDAADKVKDAAGSNPRLALAVIPAAAIKPPADGPYASFEFFTVPRLDPEVSGDINNEIGKAIVDARLASAGLDAAKIRAITDRPRPEAVAVTKQGDKKTNQAALMLIPGAFMFLLWISVFTCGQQLLTTTIEEKSSRVMEVLLSAVSPIQLMTGKIVGQMVVGLLILLVYGGAGIASLIALSQMQNIDLMMFVYLVVYFVIAFFLIASMMAAVGSAVSDIREAQTLLGPVMMILIIPMMLWLPIMRNPNSTFATVCSFVPPISPFIMVLRLAGPEKIPLWQVIGSIVLGGVYIWAFLWGTAKIFRIGVLLYGKPPNVKTLIKWVRMA
jgi:ABC-2 type transport system permease protein